MSFFKFLLKRITATIPLLIGLRLPRTLFLALITLVLGQLMGVLLGIFAAVHQYRWGDIVATVIAFIGIVIPKFVVARVMLYFLVFVWHYPYVGALYSSEYVIQDHFSYAKLLNFLKHTWPIPFISIWAGSAYTTRMMRGNLLDVMNTQYIEIARAIGLSRGKVLFKQTLANW